MKRDVSFQAQLPWPELGDELFTPQGNHHHNARLNVTNNKLDLYATGYRNAAQQLIAHVLEYHYDIDTLVYPIVFLYRHYLELRLKELIREGRRLVDNDEPFPKEHPLKTLWRLCRTVIDKSLPDEGKNLETLEVMDNYINQFAEFDNNSFSFRYPMKKDDSLSLPEELMHINIEQFSRAMERVANFLDAVSMAISVYHDYKAEMDAENATEMGIIAAENESALRDY